MLPLGLSLAVSGLAVREGTPEDKAKESAFSAFCALLFAAIALASRSCNRSFVLLLGDPVLATPMSINQHHIVNRGRVHSAPASAFTVVTGGVEGAGFFEGGTASSAPSANILSSLDSTPATAC
jgi:hypothetical protein